MNGSVGGVLTRPKPLIVLALMMLSLAATALAQAQGGENGTNQTVAPIAKADIPDKEDSDLLDNVDKLVGILVGLTVLYAFFRRRGKKVPSDDGGNIVENVKDSAISFGDQCPTIKSDRIEGGVHITYPSPKEPAVAEKTLGKINNIPHPHNPNFTGRVDLLDRLSEALASGERAAFTQTSAITGLGGVGKTQLALEYSYRHADDYQVVWWVRSEEPSTLAADYAGLAARLDLPEKNAKDQRVIVEAVRCWLEQNGGWLLVFDNAQEPEDLKDYLPRTGRGHVIITSRNPNWGGTAKPLLVDVFSREESIEFLQSRTGQHGGADALADALGDLPLALEQAAAYILATKITLADYLELFQTRRNELWKDEKKPESYREKVETAWTVSMNRVKEEAAVGADLLNLCAFLAPDDIPRKLFSDGNGHLPESLADKLAVNRAVDTLQRYSLINATPESLSVHRLVQTVTRDRLSNEERKIWGEAAVLLVANSFPQGIDDPQTWPECSFMLPHALAVSKHVVRLEDVHESYSRLLNQVGIYLGMRAEFDASKVAFDKALATFEAFNGSYSNHPGMAKVLGNLGNVLRQKGNFEEAKISYEKALEIKKAIYGHDSNHPDVASTLMNLGTVLSDNRDPDGAKSCFDKAIAIYNDVYGPDSNHIDVALALINLGSVLLASNNLAEAEKSYGRALSIYEEVYGPESNRPDVASAVHGFGEVLFAKGDFDGAKECYAKALSIYKEIYGFDSSHPDVASTFVGLGNVLVQKGDVDGAKECYEKALLIYEDVYPDFPHPAMALTLTNLGMVLQASHDLNGAKSALDKALLIYETIYGPNSNHPDVASALIGLGNVLGEKGDLGGAKDSFQRALKILEAFFGPDSDNLDMAATLNGLGNILSLNRDLDGAKENYERSLKIFQMRLGDENPYTIAVLNNLESIKRRL